MKKIIFFFLFFSTICCADGRITISEPIRLLMRLINKDNKSRKTSTYKKAIDEQEEHIQAYGAFFYGLWQDALEDGVLGGIRWGIAGCCYQVLFVLSGKVINTTFSWWRLIKKSGISMIDRLIGRNRRPNLAQLHRLRLLLQGFNHGLRSKSTCYRVDVTNYLLVQTCKQLILNLNEVINYYKIKPSQSVIARSVDFYSFHDRQELLFLSYLLIDALDEVISDQSTEEQHHDIIQKVNNSLLVLDQLMNAIRGVHDHVQIDSGLSATIDIT